VQKLVIYNNLANDNLDEDVLNDQSEVVKNAKKTIGLDARRCVENYQAQRELERLINDELDYLDNIV